WPKFPLPFKVCLGGPVPLDGLDLASSLQSSRAYKPGRLHTAAGIPPAGHWPGRVSHTCERPGPTTPSALSGRLRRWRLRLLRLRRRRSTVRKRTTHQSRSGVKIDHIVVHYTTSRNIDGTIAHFHNDMLPPKEQTSSHYIIGRDGEPALMP